jgi:hypothetical protein
MSKTVEDLEHDLATVWSLVNELSGRYLVIISPVVFRTDHTLRPSDQLNNNNQLLEQLRTQSTVVKGQAVHTGVGFPLRRFNVDISDGEFLTHGSNLPSVP